MPAEVGLYHFTLFYFQNSFRLLFLEPARKNNSSPFDSFPLPHRVGLEIPNLGHSLVSLNSRASPVRVFRILGLPILKRPHSLTRLTFRLFRVSS